MTEKERLAKLERLENVPAVNPEVRRSHARGRGAAPSETEATV